MGGYRDGYVPFTPAVKAAALRRAGGYCEACQQPAEHLDVDHHIPHAEGGSGALSNAVCLCSSCHQQKTRAEQGRGIARRAVTRAQHTHLTEQHPNQAAAAPPRAPQAGPDGQPDTGHRPGRIPPTPITPRPPAYSPTRYTRGSIAYS